MVSRKEIPAVPESIIGKFSSIIDAGLILMKINQCF